MSQSIRPKISFIVRLWREPDAEEGDAGWRGVVRPLTEEKEVWFDGLGDLVEALRPLLRPEPSEERDH